MTLLATRLVPARAKTWLVAVLQPIIIGTNLTQIQNDLTYLLNSGFAWSNIPSTTPLEESEPINTAPPHHLLMHASTEELPNNGVESWPVILSWKAKTAFRTVFISGVLIRSSYSWSVQFPDVISSQRCAPQPLWDAPEKSRRDNNNWWSGTPAITTSSQSHYSALTPQSRDNGTDYNTWPMGPKLSSCILSLPYWVNCSNKAMWLWSCCHSLAGSSGSDKNYIAIPWIWWSKSPMGIPSLGWCPTNILK